MRFCFVSFGFDRSNYQLQPWNYIYQLAKSMISLGHEVFICTNQNYSKSKFETFEGIKIIRTDKLNITCLFYMQKLNSIFSSLNADIIFWSIGPTNIYQIPIIKKIKTPIVGIFFGPLHSFSEFRRLSFFELLRNRKFILVPLMSSFVPKYIFRKFLALEQIKSIIVLSNKSKIDLKKICPEKQIYVISPGISRRNIIKYNAIEINNLRKKYDLDLNFVLLYFGSPLTIRGLDLAIKSISILKNRIPEIKLIILSRKKDDLSAEETYVKKLIAKLDLVSKVTLVSGFLSPNQVAEYISISDCVLLPFKILQADMPLSILESLELGKIVISTNVGGIPDWLTEKGLLIEPNNLTSLQKTIFALYNNLDLAENTKVKINNYISSYPSWDDIAKNIIHSWGS